MFKIVMYILIFLLLTLLTQIGGVVFVLALSVLHILTISERWLRVTMLLGGFLFLYIVSVFLIVPPLAEWGGRVPLPCVDKEAVLPEPANVGYCLLMRNYVTPEVRNHLLRVTKQLKQTYPKMTLRYLDAGFPFWDGFPLIPHLSHKDGRKVDLAYFYQRKTDKTPIDFSPSWLGYWFYEAPLSEKDGACNDEQGWLRWDFDGLQARYRDYEMNDARTRELLKLLSRDAQKILIEPHLQRRLGVESPVIRFQGCHAARHDDHIHVQW